MMCSYRWKVQTLILLLIYYPTLPMTLRFRPMKSISNHQFNVLREAPEMNDAPIQRHYYQKPKHRYKPICDPDMYPGVDCELPTTCRPVYRYGIKQTTCDTVRPWQLTGGATQKAAHTYPDEEPFVIVQLSGTTSTMAPYVGNTQPSQVHHDINRCVGLAKCEEHTWSH